MLTTHPVHSKWSCLQIGAVQCNPKLTWWGFNSATDSISKGLLWLWLWLAEVLRTSSKHCYEWQRYMTYIKSLSVFFLVDLRATIISMPSRSQDTLPGPLKQHPGLPTIFQHCKAHCNFRFECSPCIYQIVDCTHLFACAPKAKGAGDPQWRSQGSLNIANLLYSKYWKWAAWDQTFSATSLRMRMVSRIIQLSGCLVRWGSRVINPSSG